ncbi:hypothetical protein SANTM175S_06897 [Streptomyces antimycoticus]
MFSAAGLLPARQLSTGSGVLMMSRQGGSALGVAALVVITGGAARPGLDALRAGWVFTAVTAALAAVAGAAVRTGVRADPGESGGSGTDPLPPSTCPCQLPSVLTGPWVLRRPDDDELSGEGG